ncbi:MAG: hypothetical protein M1816_000860 [Peltula sp. TS41687]|nr:MAG: hypothetical protein M1816_000860 [Peltula sp. TS41687]
MSTTTPAPLPLEPHQLIIVFNGAITTRLIASPHRAFTFEVTFLPHLWPAVLASRKPPRHFHPYQEEYIEVLEGRLSVEVEGRERVLAPEDGKVCVRPWTNHRLYPAPNDDGDGATPITTRFLLSGEQTREMFRLDTVFFQNWYGYQDQVVMEGKRMDPIQVICMFDAGGSYLSFPWWVPFSRSLSRAVGIVVGRWIGGLLGYQPFYRKWTSDWELACNKMETSFFQRRFADRTKIE